jgi:hypothetical protein
MARLPGMTLGVNDVIRLYQHGVSSAYVTSLVDIGYPHRSVDAITRLADHGVRTSYLRSMANIGYPALTPDEAATLFNAGVTPRTVQRVNKTAKRQLTVAELAGKNGKQKNADCDEK